MRKKTFITLLGCVMLFTLNFKIEKTDSIPEIKVGSQIWMTKNLDVSTFQNGDSIFHAKTDEEWLEAGKKGIAAWCYYNNDPKLGEKYGKLYNWFAVEDPRKLAPEGWLIPSPEDWKKLIDFFTGYKTGGKYLKSKNDWVNNGGGNNRSKLTILPAGNRHNNGIFHYIGEYAYFWTNKIFDDGNPIYQTFVTGHNFISTTTISKDYGYSVRCIKDR